MSIRLSHDGDTLRDEFFSLESSRDIASLLEISYDRLVYHLFKSDPVTRYQTFTVPKRSGGTRQISAPATSLKIIQRKLNHVLHHVRPPKIQVHGFVIGRSIITNAQPHTKQKFVLKIDLKDFFPSINFGRVRGMFMGVPYKRNHEVATTLAQICCFDNKLPQGAPTSPTVSNMICAKLDSQLHQLAQKYRCIYTRYADDLSFSTSAKPFPAALAAMKSTESGTELVIGDDLRNVVQANGFTVNLPKTQLRRSDARQTVTGLVTNTTLNVKRELINQIRAMLHSWEKYGLKASENEYHARYLKRHHHPDKRLPPFKLVVRGKIAFLGSVRGKGNATYVRFAEKLKSLAPELKLTIAPIPKITPGARPASPSKQYIFTITIGQPEQLALEIEAALGIRLVAYHDADIINGHIQNEMGKTTIHIYTEDRAPSNEGMPMIRGRTQTPREEFQLQQVVISHVPSPSIYRGVMSSPVTYYTPSIGRILVRDNRDSKEKAATGFLFLHQDIVLTAAHVVDPEHMTIEGVEFGSYNVGCTILHCDPIKDIALLRLDRKIKGLPVRIRLAIQMPQDRGMPCVALGFPDTPGFHPSISAREVRVVAKKATYLGKQELLELSEHFGSGMSGSPVLTDRLSLIGMIVGFPSSEDTSTWPKWPVYAIPSDEIESVCKDVGMC